MIHLKLIKGLSWSDGTVTATQKKPDVYVDDEAAASELAASGFFTVIPSSAAAITQVESGGSPTEERPDYDALVKLKKDDLIAYANERDIDISKCRTKEDILAVVSAAYGGSMTMIDLQ